MFLEFLEFHVKIIATFFVIIFYYYSFKIFSLFWLAKSTRLIHHNQLLTKFGRILCLARKWRVKNAAFLQVNAPLTEKTWGRGWVVLEGGISYIPWCIASYYIIKLLHVILSVQQGRDSWTTVESDLFCR